VGQPVAAVGPRQVMGNARGLGQDPAAIRPDPRVQGPRRGHACRAAWPLSRPQGVGPSAAEVSVGPRGQGTPQTGQLTRATADQAAEPGLMGGGVPAGQVGMACAPGLDGRAGLRADDGRHRDGDPVLGWGRPPRLPRAHRAQRGRADPRWGRAGARAGGGAQRHGCAEDPPHGGHRPAWLPATGRALGRGQPLGNALEGGWRVEIRLPGEDRGHHHGLHRIKPQARGIARAFRRHDRPIGSDGQGSRWPRRHVAWWPRRLRSVIKVRAYSATAPRIWSSSCAWGA
jgi:hypothetical protein